jgi:hypothetical protein
MRHDCVTVTVTIVSLVECERQTVLNFFAVACERKSLTEEHRFHWLGGDFTVTVTISQSP